MATSPSQGGTLSSDSVIEDDLLGLLASISWQLEDCDSINLINGRSQNLAHFCAQLRYHRVLIAVIERGVDIHAKYVNRWTPLDVALLHRDEDTSQPSLSISDNLVYLEKPSGIMDEFHPFKHPTTIEVAAARTFYSQRYPNAILALIFRHWPDIWLTHLVHCTK